MATNFPSSPSNGATHTFGGTVYTYNSTKGVWKAAAGEAVTISDTPPSNPGAGDLWFDSSVAKTYIYYNDGSSNQWVQMNPSGGSDGTDGADGADATGDGESPIVYTEPVTSHTLNTDGTTSTVQMQAVDPEGTAITYGIAYANSTNALPDQLASATTIDQSTGTYTFTPTTNTSNEGSFKARLSASDGITSATRFVNFSLSFYDSLDALNDGSCIALYKLNGNGDDVSGNYNSTGYIAGSSSGFDNSIYKYDGSLNSTSTTLDLPNVRTSYPISVSAWIRPSNVSTTAFTEVLNMLMGSSQRLSLGVHSYNSVFSPIIAYGGSNHWYFTPNTAFVNDTWYHIIFSIVGSNDSSHGVYINGSASVTPTNTGGAHGGSAGWALGGNAAGGEHFLGHIDHVRIFNKALSATEAATLYNKGG